jgi:hexokinase
MNEMSSEKDTTGMLFRYPVSEARRTIREFQKEMDLGLRGEVSSLKMLPSYVDNPTGQEKGEFLALDLGGSNFRILRVILKGDGSAPEVTSRKFSLSAEETDSNAETLFGALARSIKSFAAGLGGGVARPLGFTFSFPIRQTSIDKGELIVWTKGWSASGVEGHDVVGLLNAALAREGAAGVRVVSLDNDTTGTQMARAYLDPACDVGCILGTGTNICYRERVERIAKPLGPYAGASMIVNMESGGFDKELPRNRFDERLDAESENPGSQWEEKMVSGKYLGELVRLIVVERTAQGLMFGGRLPAIFAVRERFGSERVCAIKEDVSERAEAVQAMLADLGIGGASPEDAIELRRIAWIVSNRAARIAAAVLATTVTWIDPDLERDHTIAIDGSVFEKHPGFAAAMDAAFREILGERAGRVRTALTHDGSGLGAAVIAAATNRKLC